MRPSRIAFILVLLLSLLETARLWLITPATLAVHFNAPGNPDRFAPKTEFFDHQLGTVLTIVVVSILMQILLVYLPIGLINIPNRKVWLSPTQRPATLNKLGSFLDFLFAATLVVIHAGFEISVFANLRIPVAFLPQLMVPFIIGYFVFAIGMLLWLNWEFRLPPSSK